MSGVFAVNREVWDHPMFAPEPFTEREAWIWMCGAAAYKPMRARCGRAVVDLERGQLAFATRFLATKWKWSEARVRRFLNRLEIDAAVTLKPTRETTQITICNYDKHQFSRRAGDSADESEIDALPTHPRRKEEEVNKYNKEEKKKEPSLRSGALALVETSSKPKRAKARVPIPDDWKTGEPEIAHARSLGFTDAMIAPMADAFANHHRAKGSVMADWLSAWRTWCGNEIKFNRGNGNGYRGPRPLQDDSKSTSAAAGRLAEAAKRGEFRFGPRPSLLPEPNESSVVLLSKG